MSHLQVVVVAVARVRNFPRNQCPSPVNNAEMADLEDLLNGGLRSS